MDTRTLSIRISNPFIVIISRLPRAVLHGKCVVTFQEKNECDTSSSSGSEKFTEMYQNVKRTYEVCKA